MCPHLQVTADLFNTGHQVTVVLKLRHHDDYRPIARSDDQIAGDKLPQRELPVNDQPAAEH